MTSVPAVPSSSAGTQRDGRSWDQTVSLGGRGVSCVWAEVHAVCFYWTGLTGGVEAEPVEVV